MSTGLFLVRRQRIWSEETARQYFPDENPVGRRLRTDDGETEIIGVVGNIRRAALADQPRADMYFPFERAPAASTTLFLNTAGEPAAALPAVRTALRNLEPDIAIFGARSMEEIAGASVAAPRLAMRLLTGFAVVALLLATVGVYGVMAYSVRRRTRELGTRVALGASRGDIVWLVMRQGAGITATGLFVGLVAGLAASRSLSAVLYDVPASDPLSVAGAIGVLGLAALAACYLPARRAGRVDPARTLAAE
jgi:predicted lysophospholipase L1 biosynthesis ABC-type transport system permease subunit